MTNEADELEKELADLLNLSKNNDYQEEINITKPKRKTSKEPKAKKEHICEICNKSFSYPQNLRQHELIHTGMRPFECEICGRAFGRKWALDCHWKRHFPESKKSKKCNVCKKQLSTLQALQNHVKRHFGEWNYGCDTCGKRFITSSKLNYHKRIHEEFGFHCDTCKKKFLYKVNLKHHILEIHLKYRPFTCPICDKCFPRRHYFDKHLLVHENVKPFSKIQLQKYECKFCNITITGCRSFCRHVAQKHPAINFQQECIPCGFSFDDVKAFLSHDMYHSGSYNFMCDFCGRAYFSKDSMKRHILNKHLGEGIFHCNICLKMYTCEKRLNSHKKLGHK